VAQPDEVAEAPLRELADAEVGRQEHVSEEAVEADLHRDKPREAAQVLRRGDLVIDERVGSAGTFAELEGRVRGERVRGADVVGERVVEEGGREALEHTGAGDP
jgi:hypothetical protein